MKAPNPGRGWRLLKVGEVITAGCEAIDACDPKDTWDELFLSVGCEITQSLVRESGIFVRTREGVKPTPADPDWNCLALRMYKAGSIREVRAIYEKATRGKK